jgi:membrane protein
VEAAVMSGKSDPLDIDEPEGPTDLKKSSWVYVLRKTGREFSKDDCTDQAAALTYYAVLSAFPAALAMLSLLSLVGQGKETVNSMIDIIEQIGGEGTSSGMIEDALNSLSTAQGAGLTFVLSIVLALWSASGYVSAFGRSMNRIYGVGEGRPFWKLRPLMMLVTLLAILMAACVALSLVLTGPVARAVGDAIGMGSTAVQVWDIVKWPVILLLVMAIVAALYQFTPNVKQPKFRWLSVGAAVAIIVWVLASAAFGVYVGNFGSYNKTYGTLAGVVVFLLWLWITNLALLFGAELDAEIERGRELQAGIAAEKAIQLPPRDTRASDKAAARQRKHVERGRRLRLSRRGQSG